MPLGYALVARLAEDVGVRLLAIKGPVLALQGLRAERTSVDIDVLVEPAGLVASTAALEPIGLARRAASTARPGIVPRHSVNHRHPGPARSTCTTGSPGSWPTRARCSTSLWHVGVTVDVAAPALGGARPGGTRRDRGAALPARRGRELCHRVRRRWWQLVVGSRPRGSAAAIGPGRSGRGHGRRRAAAAAAGAARRATSYQPRPLAVRGGLAAAVAEPGHRGFALAGRAATRAVAAHARVPLRAPVARSASSSDAPGARSRREGRELVGGSLARACGVGCERFPAAVAEHRRLQDGHDGSSSRSIARTPTSPGSTPTIGVARRSASPTLPAPAARAHGERGRDLAGPG